MDTEADEVDAAGEVDADVDADADADADVDADADADDGSESEAETVAATGPMTDSDSDSDSDSEPDPNTELYGLYRGKWGTLTRHDTDTYVFVDKATGHSVTLVGKQGTTAYTEMQSKRGMQVTGDPNAQYSSTWEDDVPEGRRAGMIHLPLKTVDGYTEKQISDTLFHISNRMDIQGLSRARLPESSQIHLPHMNGIQVIHYCLVCCDDDMDGKDGVVAFMDGFTAKASEANIEVIWTIITPTGEPVYQKTYFEPS